MKKSTKISLSFIFDFPSTLKRKPKREEEKEEEEEEEEEEGEKEEEGGGGGGGIKSLSRQLEPVTAPLLNLTNELAFHRMNQLNRRSLIHRRR